MQYINKLSLELQTHIIVPVLFLKWYFLIHIINFINALSFLCYDILIHIYILFLLWYIVKSSSSCICISNKLWFDSCCSLDSLGNCIASDGIPNTLYLLLLSLKSAYEDVFVVLALSKKSLSFYFSGFKSFVVMACVNLFACSGVNSTI